METKTDVFMADEVTKLKMEVDCGTLYVKEDANTDKITVEAQEDGKGTYSAGLEAGKLKVVYRLPNKTINVEFPFVKNMDCETVITVTIPKGKVFEKVRAEVGAGILDMQDAQVLCGKAKIEVGAGKFKAGTLQADKQVKAEAGAGKIKIGHINTALFIADCGAGELHVAGDVSGDVDIDCGVGKCEIDLERSSAEYNFDLDCGIGKIYLNGEKIHGKEGKRAAAGEAVGTLHMDCGVGSICINTR